MFANMARTAAQRPNIVSSPADGSGSRGALSEAAAKTIALLLHRRGIKYREFERAAGLAEDSLGRMLKGIRPTTTKQVVAMARALEVPVGDLLEPSDTPMAGVVTTGQGVGEGNVYGRAEDILGAPGMGYAIRPIYPTGEDVDLTAVTAERWPRPLVSRPARLTEVREDGYGLLQGDREMLGRRPDPVAPGDVWWVRQVHHGAPRTGDLVAAWVEPEDGPRPGVVLRAYAGPSEDFPEGRLYAEPEEGQQVPVRGRWTVWAVAEYGEELMGKRPRRDA